MRDWFYSFTNYIEYSHEEKDSLAKLRKVIAFEQSNGKVTPALVDFTSNFLTTKFQDRLPNLCLRVFKYAYYGWVADNCFTESENSTIERDAFGPKSSYRLHVSADATIQHTNERFRQMISDATSAFKSRKPVKPNETEIDTLARELSASLLDSCNDFIIEQYEKSNDYWGCEMTAESQLQDRLRLFAFRSKDLGNANCNDRRPRYSRTRVINVREIQVGNETCVVLQCGCGCFFRYRCACRHIYALLDRKPCVDDTFPEKFKSYEMFYGKEGYEEFTANCDSRTSLLEKAEGIIIHCRLEDICLKAR